VQPDRLLLLVITVIRYTRERKKHVDKSHIKLQQTIVWYLGYLIRKPEITYFINVYLESIDKNDIENLKTHPVYLSRLATTKPNPNCAGAGQNWPALYR
jgi:hypothetical protein